MRFYTTAPFAPIAGFFTISLLAFFGPVAEAQITTTGPFVGPLSESFEGLALGESTSPLAIFGGAASLSASSPYVYSSLNESFGFSLITSGLAGTADGLQGFGSRTAESAGDIVFGSTVTQFGAYWGAGTGGGLTQRSIDPTFPDPATVTLRFFDAADGQIGTPLTFTYTRSSDGSGALDWHGYQSTTGIKRVSFSGVQVAMDSLQAGGVAAPEPGSLALVFPLLGLLGIGSILPRRK